MNKKSKSKYLIISAVTAATLVLITAGAFLYNNSKITQQERDLIKQGYVNTGKIIDNGMYSCAGISPECGYCSFQGGVELNGYCYEKPRYEGQFN